MEFFLLVGILTLLIVSGGFYFSKQLFRRNFVNFAKTQERALRLLAEEMPLPSSAKFPLKSGEGFVYQLRNVSLVEPRRGTRTSSRSTHAATFALAKGLYYTVGSSRGVSPEPDDELKVIDQGTATFTSKRVVFAGSKQTREWAFAKMLGWDEGAGALLTIAVSNRQKVSGIQLNGRTELMPSVALQIAIAVGEDGWGTARGMCLRGADNARKQAEFVSRNPSAGEDEITRYAEALDSGDGADASDIGVGANTSAGRKANPPANKRGESTGSEKLYVIPHYKIALEDLRNVLGAANASEHVTKATLSPERDSSGHQSISVYVLDRKLGNLEIGESKLAQIPLRLKRDVQVAARIVFEGQFPDSVIGKVELSIEETSSS